MKILLTAFTLLAGFAFPARADQEVKQVEVEARIAEVNTNYARDIGVDYDFHANEAHTVQETGDVLRHTDAKLRLPAAIRQDGTFGDDIGVRKIQAPAKTAAVTAEPPVNPPVALKVVPKISPNGNVIMDVHPEAAGLIDSEAPKIEPAVKIPDSAPIAVGGLKTAGISEKKKDAPVVSNIPILGRLFRHEDKAQEKKI